MLRLLLLLAAFMQVYFSFIDFQLLIIAYALQNIRRRRVIATAFYRRVLERRRRRIRRRLWRLPRPVNSWFEVLRRMKYLILNVGRPRRVEGRGIWKRVELVGILKVPVRHASLVSVNRISFVKKEVSNDGFDRSFCFMALRPDMTSSEAGHRPFWSYVLCGSYVRCRDIRVALVLERWWHILCLSKHLCLWTRPMPILPSVGSISTVQPLSQTIYLRQL